MRRMRQWKRWRNRLFVISSEARDPYGHDKPLWPARITASLCRFAQAGLKPCPTSLCRAFGALRLDKPKNVEDCWRQLQSRNVMAMLQQLSVLVWLRHSREGIGTHLGLASRHSRTSLARRSRALVSPILSYLVPGSLVPRLREP